jgi:hypothetical protein
MNASLFAFQVSVRGGTPLGTGALECTFDEALSAFEQLDRMFIEPDGSFVWTGAASDGQPWQVDGNLIDQGDCLAYVELKGHCPEAQFDQILTALGWPDAPLVFELTRQGVVIDEQEFRRIAASQAGAV